MAENISARILETFSVEGKDIATYSPLVLAFIGDDVYDLIIRTYLVGQANRPVDQLHKKASRIVKAGTQKKVYEAIAGELTEEETAVFKRGRNAKSHTIAKHASVGEYRMATGLETLFGYLYLKGDTVRILELMKLGLERTGLLTGA